MSLFLSSFDRDDFSQLLSRAGVAHTGEAPARPKKSRSQKTVPASAKSEPAPNVAAKDMLAQKVQDQEAALNRVQAAAQQQAQAQAQLAQQAQVQQVALDQAKAQVQAAEHVQQQALHRLQAERSAKEQLAQELAVAKQSATQQAELLATQSADSNVIAQLRSLSAPNEHSLQAALDSLLKSLHRIVQVPLFIADKDGLLLAGGGKNAEAAAAMAIDSQLAMAKGAVLSAQGLNGLLFSFSQNAYLVFHQERDGKKFIVGAGLNENTSVKALEITAKIIWNTLYSRTKNA